MTCSAHYTDFLENFLAGLERLALDAGVIVVAEDAPAYAVAVAWAARGGGSGTRRRAVAPAAAAPVSGRVDFESRGFAELMSRRARLIATELARLAGDAAWAARPDARLVFTDLDVAWVSDPTAYFAGKSGGGGGCDAWAQTQHRERGLLNPGFLALRPTPGAAALLAAWAAILDREGGRNLPAFNAAIRDAPRGAFAVCALPPETFASAKRTFLRPRWRAGEGPAVTAHANWIDGHDAKRSAFATHGAWLLGADAAPLIPSPPAPPGEEDGPRRVRRRESA